MKEEIVNRNNKEQYHGYNEWYNGDYKITFRVTYKNGNKFGYGEYHFASVKETYYYIR